MCVHAEMAAAEMQLLRQALDKLQSETQILDDELARSREQAIFSEFERAELSNELEVVTAQLRSCEASKAELEGTIAKVTPPDLPSHIHTTASLCSRLSLTSMAFVRLMTATGTFGEQIHLQRCCSRSALLSGTELTSTHLPDVCMHA